MDINKIKTYYLAEALPEGKLRHGGYAKGEFRDFVEQATDEQIAKGQSALEAHQFLHDYIRDNL